MRFSPLSKGLQRRRTPPHLDTRFCGHGRAVFQAIKERNLPYERRI